MYDVYIQCFTLIIMCLQGEVLACILRSIMIQWESRIYSHAVFFISTFILCINCKRVEFVYCDCLTVKSDAGNSWVNIIINSWKRNVIGHNQTRCSG